MVVDPDGGSLSVAQIGLSLKKRLAHLPCRFRAHHLCNPLFHFVPLKTMASLNVLASSSDHRTLFFIAGTGCWARRADTSPWCHFLASFRKPCWEGRLLSQNEHANAAISSSPSSLELPLQILGTSIDFG